MNLNILDFFCTDDHAAPSTRRKALGDISKLVGGLAVASMTTATLSARPSYGQSAPSAIDILNYALTLEYLEDSYYRQGLAADGLITGDGRTIYGQIAKHESAHVALLASVINDLGGTPVEFADEDFDFTAGGAFDPFNNYDQYLLLSQAFEDTGVRAYKGQAGFLAGNELLTPALQIHSVEARHAAEVRRLRAMMGVSIKPWITLDDGTDGTPVEAVYAGEEAITQAGVDLTTLGNYSAEQASEAYDEPLTMDDVAGPDGIAAPFFA